MPSVEALQLRWSARYLDVDDDDCIEVAAFEVGYKLASVSATLLSIHRCQYQSMCVVLRTIFT